LSHLTSKITNTLFIFLSDKYASGEASLDSCEAYLSVCESNDTLPRAPFTVWIQQKLIFSIIDRLEVDMRESPHKHAERKFTFLMPRNRSTF
jgi:hypothetical protein